jgi:hypothetical protein
VYYGADFVIDSLYVNEGYMVGVCSVFAYIWKINVTNFIPLFLFVKFNFCSQKVELYRSLPGEGMRACVVKDKMIYLSKHEVIHKIDIKVQIHFILCLTCCSPRM